MGGARRSEKAPRRAEEELGPVASISADPDPMPPGVASPACIKGVIAGVCSAPRTLVPGVIQPEVPGLPEGVAPISETAEGVSSGRPILAEAVGSLPEEAWLGVLRPARRCAMLI